MPGTFLETSRRLRCALLATALGFVLVAALVPAADHVDAAALLPDGAVVLAGLLATVACGLRVVHVERERRPWALVSVAVALQAAGWGVQVADGGAAVADTLALGSYAPFALALVLLLRRALVRAPANVWLDGALAATAAGAAGTTLAYAPLPMLEAGIEQLGFGTLQPLGDLLLLTILLGVLAMASWRVGARWITVGAGLVCWFAGDAAALAAVAAGHGQAGAARDLLWIAGFAAFAVAAWQETRATESPRPAGARLLLVPTALSAGALVLLCLDRVQPTDDVAVALALVAVAVGLARTTLTLHEVQLLADARHESLTDELTGLPGRRHFHRRLDQTLATATSERVPFGLLLFDLDRFKELNDTLGHGAGDQLLQLVGRRLTACMPRDALVARLGGDEFAVLLAPGSDRDAAAVTAAAVVEAIERPFDIEGVELDIGVSVGLAVFPGDADEPGELLRRADVAMYLAKGAGGGVAVYDPARDLHTRDRLALGRQLRAGLERGELRVWYQPKVDPQLGRVLGVEALVRWEHPAHGLLMPPDFLPLATRGGLMPDITRCVLDEALGQVARWREGGLDLGLAVNLAVTDLHDPDLPGDVAALLERHAVPGTSLALEVTEDGLIADPEQAVATLDSIARHGVHISLDDFGTGWSSLAHLRRLPVHELKIDRSFIRDMARKDEDAAIVRTTLDLARSLRLRVVAEGVEDDETWTRLADLGCDAIQGYVLSLPLPGAQLGAWLAARRDGAIARCATPDQRVRRTAPEPLRYRL